MELKEDQSEQKTSENPAPDKSATALSAPDTAPDKSADTSAPAKSDGGSISTAISTDLPSYKYDESKSMDDNASDLAELKATGEAIKDNEFIGKVAEKKKEQISQSADLNKDIRINKKTAEKIHSATEIDEAFFEQWKPVLTWGGIEAPSKKTFMVFMLILILPFYIIEKCVFELPLAIIKSFFGAINGLLEKIKTFGKISRGIAFSILILGVIALCAYVILFYLDKYNIISIFN